MITGESKNKVDKLWEIFWTGGLTNPLDVIEQITYLMFIRDLDEMDNTRKKDSAMLGLSYESIFSDKEHLKWSLLQDKPAEIMYQTVQGEVFPFIKTLHSDKGSAYAKYMEDAIYKIPTPRLLEQIITALDELYALINKQTDRKDAKGDLYEYMLSKLTTAGTNGQFRTPRHIIRMMVELLDLRPHDVICDPACGTSGFLVIISMPSGVFKPYAGVSTAVIIFTKTGAGGTDKVWFYDMQSDGYSLDDKRTPLDISDIPDIVTRFNNPAAEEGRARTEQSFLVPKAEIVGNGYDLSLNKYKQSAYVEESYPHPREILAEINALEREIQDELKELEAMLGG